jgi:hypothetical protein
MAKNYEVLDSTELIRATKRGAIEKYYHVTIQTKGGTTLTVDIDEKDYTAEKAAPILDAKAIEADKILKL